MRANGCSFQDFLNAMAEDDEFDSQLTEKGITQAMSVGISAAAKYAAAQVQVVVASPLSRAIDTADLVLKDTAARRIVREEWREISGLLLNAKRMKASEIKSKYSPKGWDTSRLAPEEDELWTPGELESTDACAERGYLGLRWIWENVDDEHVCVAAHGGIFSYLMQHPRVDADERMSARFHNCELRGCEMTLVAGAGAGTAEGKSGVGDGEETESSWRFRLQWINLEADADAPDKGNYKL